MYAVKLKTFYNNSRELVIVRIPSSWFVFRSGKIRKFWKKCQTFWFRRL